jgi:hypothetical protein
MHAKPRRRRPTGNLNQLKARLWIAVDYAASLIENEAEDHETRLKGATTLVQAALAYSRIVEQHDMAQQMAELQRLASGNGHQG